jgi:hypothetical protein
MDIDFNLKITVIIFCSIIKYKINNFFKKKKKIDRLEDG